jgi:hypothetical protein
LACECDLKMISGDFEKYQMNLRQIVDY